MALPTTNKQSILCDNIMQKYDALIEIFNKQDSIAIADFTELMGDFDSEIEIIKSLGIAIDIKDDSIIPKINGDIFEATFCIVDIETTGFSPKDNEIIEIGAIKYRNGEILERFERQIFTPFIPHIITELTGITEEMLENAPPISQVLQDFKAFLQDCIFMAHNLRFDFNFINSKLEMCGIPIMKNTSLCTLELAKKTIIAEKYGLGYLNEFLEINSTQRHRAIADCIIALKVFETSLLNLPSDIATIRDLLAFIGKANSTKTKKRRKTFSRLYEALQESKATPPDSPAIANVE